MLESWKCISSNRRNRTQLDASFYQDRSCDTSWQVLLLYIAASHTLTFLRLRSKRRDDVNAVCGCVGGTQLEE